MGRMQGIVDSLFANRRHKGGNGLHVILLGIIFFSLLWPAFSHAFDDAIVQNAENPKDYVSITLPYPIETVYNRAVLMFESDTRDYYENYNPAIYDLPEPVKNFHDLTPAASKKFLAVPLVRPNKFYVFFGAYISVQEVLTHLTPLAAMGHTNAALQRYAALPQNARTEDLYIWSPDTPYWHSEYSLDGKPLPFKSFFILHMTAVDNNHTEVEIIEKEPTVRIEGRSHVDIHGKVRNYEMREVEPTTSDREFLLSCLSQFIERNVPGRHYFRCRDKGEKVEEPLKFTTP